MVVGADGVDSVIAKQLTGVEPKPVGMFLIYGDSPKLKTDPLCK